MFCFVIKSEELTAIKFRDSMISVERTQWFGVDLDIYYYPGLKHINQVFSMGSSDKDGASELQLCG